MVVSDERPTRLITPPPPTAVDTLPYKINSQTREIHTELNKLITARLPLALPPTAANPLPYLHGIHTFAQLYLTFEEAWQDLICAHLTASTSSDASTSSADERLKSHLSSLVPPQLWRTQRLEADIAYLKALGGDSVDLPILDNNSVVNKISTHMEEDFEARPHVLLAYAWVLYMAIFSGGRWMRSQLLSAGSEFWGHDLAGKGDVPADQRGLSLFCFEGGKDGEDVKAEFKRRFEKADEVLSEAQKGEVVRQAKAIFEACVEMVHDLDSRLGTPAGMPSGQTDVDSKTPTADLKGDAKGGPGRGRTEGDGRNDVTVGGLMKELLPEAAQGEFRPNAGAYVTKGVPAWAAVVAIALGIAVWWVLHRHGLLSNL